MNTAVDRFDRARSRMAADFRTMITDGEDLLKAAATVSDDGFAAARAKFEDKLNCAKVALGEASQPVIEKARRTATLADDYVRANPWTVAGIAALAGALIGLLVTKR